jgi:hypothetical protein
VAVDSPVWLDGVSGGDVQTFLRVLNLIAGPILTLWFAARFKGLTFAGSDAGKEIGGALAGLAMLAVELVLTQGPKRSAWLRRWLDPRAVFEGVWLQEDLRGTDNALSIFSMDYDGDSDAYKLAGRAYSKDGIRWATWKSTHVFIDKRELEATYRWQGDVAGLAPVADPEKSGLAVMSLRRPPALALPLTGEGRVLHVGESLRIDFRLRRVTPRLLAELGLPFTLRELRLDAHGEEEQLAAADLRQRAAPKPA